MQYAGVRWKDSQTKEIYQANARSEMLMEYIEGQLIKHDLIKECADHPNAERGYGNMIYKYNLWNTLLTTAPRKRDSYIHVVLTFGELDHVILVKNNLKVGKGRGKFQDVKIYNETEIDTLIKLILEKQQKDFEAVDKNEAKKDINEISKKSLLEWVEEYEKAKEYSAVSEKLDIARLKFIAEFKELERLKSGEISLGEFKKVLDAKAKTKIDGINIWGFSGFSGQMFFNQLYKQAEHADAMDELEEAFLTAVSIVEQEDDMDFEWVVEHINEFIDKMNEIRNKAIEMGLSPQKCANTNFAPFFISFFWGLQRLTEIPIYYKSSRDALGIIGYKSDANVLENNGEKYLQFLFNIKALQQDIIQISGNTFDANEVEHLLYYIDSTTKKQILPNVGEIDPIYDEPFAQQLSDFFHNKGYVVQGMETLEDFEPTSHKLSEKNIVWRFECSKKNVAESYIFLWFNETDINAAVYLENEDASIRLLTEINENNEQAFLTKLEWIFTSQTSPLYTLNDAHKETYMEEGILKEWLDLLAEKRQIILYGPPGTGKTFVAQRLAKILAQNEQRVRLVQFHPSYTYEEFIEGLRPDLVKGENGLSHLQVVVKPGIFFDLCKEAGKLENRKKPYVLIIDEINRANTAKVFGELLYALEYRNEPIPLPYSKEKLIVPDNIYIIGTMNSSDRSLAQLDLALRRRFQFIPFTTLDSGKVLERFLEQHVPEMIDLYRLVQNVNKSLESQDHTIGHSYFMTAGLNVQSLQRIWKYQIIPYLEEHFVMEPERVKDYALDTLLDGGGYFP